jgi:hypothetical protein
MMIFVYNSIAMFFSLLHQSKLPTRYNRDIYKSRLIISKITKGLLIHVIHYILGDAYIEIKSLLKRISYQPRMKAVKFKNLFQCRIRHGARTNCYLKVDEKRNLEIVLKIVLQKSSSLLVSVSMTKFLFSSTFK